MLANTNLAVVVVSIRLHVIEGRFEVMLNIINSMQEDTEN